MRIRHQASDGGGGRLVWAREGGERPRCAGVVAGVTTLIHTVSGMVWTLVPGWSSLVAVRGAGDQDSFRRGVALRVEVGQVR